MGILRTVTNERIPLSMRKTFTFVDQKRFWKYVADALWSVSDCYVGYVLDESYIE